MLESRISMFSDLIDMGETIMIMDEPRLSFQQLKQIDNIKITANEVVQKMQGGSMSLEDFKSLLIGRGISEEWLDKLTFDKQYFEGSDENTLAYKLKSAVLAAKEELYKAKNCHADYIHKMQGDFEVIAFNIPEEILKKLQENFNSLKTLSDVILLQEKYEKIKAECTKSPFINSADFSILDKIFLQWNDNISAICDIPKEDAINKYAQDTDRREALYIGEIAAQKAIHDKALADQEQSFKEQLEKTLMELKKEIASLTESYEGSLQTSHEKLSLEKTQFNKVLSEKEQSFKEQLEKALTEQENKIKDEFKRILKEVIVKKSNSYARGLKTTIERLQEENKLLFNRGVHYKKLIAEYEKEIADREAKIKAWFHQEDHKGLEALIVQTIIEAKLAKQNAVKNDVEEVIKKTQPVKEALLKEARKQYDEKEKERAKDWFPPANPILHPDMYEYTYRVGTKYGTTTRTGQRIAEGDHLKELEGNTEQFKVKYIGKGIGAIT